MSVLKKSSSGRIIEGGTEDIDFGEEFIQLFVGEVAPSWWTDDLMYLVNQLKGFVYGVECY